MSGGNTGFQVGLARFPLPASTANSLLQDADPAIFECLAFFQAMLELHLGARWDAEVVKAGLPGLVGKVAALAIPYDPSPYLTQAQLAPPGLALFPTAEKVEEETRTWYRLTGTWTLQWMLPTLTAAQHLQLYPFLRAAGKVVVDRNEVGGDPTYHAGARFAARAGLESLTHVETTYGDIAKPKSDLFFPCLQVELRAVERRAAAPDQTGFTGTDTELDVVDDAGDVDLVELASTVTP